MMLAIYYVRDNMDFSLRERVIAASLRGLVASIKLYEEVSRSYGERMTLEEVFEEFNGEKFGKQIRSMSVGDIVVLNDSAYVCAPTGWVSAEIIPEFVD
jgi:hypothetical protein